MLYRVKPRIPPQKFSLDSLGRSFSLCFFNEGDRISTYLETHVSAETLRSLFGVERAGYEDLLKTFGREVWMGEARLKKESDLILSDFCIYDAAGIVNSMGGKGGICISISRDASAKEILLRRAEKLERRASKSGIRALETMSQELRRKIPKILPGRLLVLAQGERELKALEKAVGDSSTAELKWKRKKLRSAEELGKALRLPELSFWEKAFGFSSWIAWNEDRLIESLKLPDPSLHRSDFSRDFRLPSVLPKREGSFRVGVLEDGRELRLSLEDLKRHVYVVGQTGSGKTTFLKTLVHRLKASEIAAVVVIDPHGDMALELAEEIPESRFLHPLKSPFGVNPLDLPHAESRDHAVTIAIDILLEIFKDVLRLTDSAVNVKYILQVLLRMLYMKTDSPTMRDIYEAVLLLRSGELEIDAEDPKWEVQMEALKSMREQSFISALSRLEPYAHDSLLRRLTSKTTLDFEKLITPGSVLLFSIPKADLGENLARLIASTVFMKLWFEVLARARLGKSRTPLFLIVDEFQFISDLPIIETVLSEARKYGLYLVIAHQHTGQISEELLQSILTNCAVKVSFAVGGGDVKRLSSMDPAFSETLSEALGMLSVGQAVFKIASGPGEQQIPPIVAKVDLIPHERRRKGEIMSREFDPGEPEERNLKELLNPVLIYIDPADPLEDALLREIYKSREISISQLVMKLEADGEKVDKALGRLLSRGFVSVAGSGKERVVIYRKGIAEGLRRKARSEEWFLSAFNVSMFYYRKGCIAVPTKENPGGELHPDIVALPVDRKTWRPRYSRAAAVFIESCDSFARKRASFGKIDPKSMGFHGIHVWIDRKCASSIPREEIEERRVELHFFDEIV